MHPAPAMYVIRVKGHMGPALAAAFHGMASRQHEGQTVLTGRLDQAALYGVLAEMEALALELIEVRRVTAGPDVTEAG